MTSRPDPRSRLGSPGRSFGGYEQSGLGREAGSAGIEEVLETKAIQR